MISILEYLTLVNIFHWPCFWRLFEDVKHISEVSNKNKQQLDCSLRQECLD